MTPRRFRTLVFRYYEREGRHGLPWRRTKDAYRILVSEVMLQQTQVERVIPYYTSFLKEFPTVRALAEAPLAPVLKAWQGLGYNRRAKMLHQAAKDVMRTHAGRMPRTIEDLESLPGVGPYTARAVAAFAYNTDSIFIETNIRTAFTHHFFDDAETVHDRELVPLLEAAYPKGSAREWYAALMDYGSFLKRSGVRINAKRTGYAKQKAFKGSLREVRGAVLRELGAGARSLEKLNALFPKERHSQVQEALDALKKEGMVRKAGTRYALA